MGVLVLNASMEPLHTVSVPHAVRMLVRKVAEIHEAEVDSTIGVFPLPRVVRLVRYVVTRWRYARPPRWSRRGVLRRDGHRCAYCGGPADTVDHITPLSRGGERTSWLNTVACCGRAARSCNSRKGDRLPAEAGMRLLVTPYVPTWADLYG
ncbi:HNH endonuclease [Saccharothrix violaceirubra]|uniref:5-methylcytosine-specific restriction endonuclease McrA n=1 Tax=Saccharothrix violaceirubra TaxID=413306 RepID=A0A7W7T3S9_9PSEU|nr:HNH endonuclease [Saccharothrix violaceirubra]MBB4965976.1 5-methylcytosine-specific restriction endonuclease McrA [Saccharothrix violaceirubra]